MLTKSVWYLGLQNFAEQLERWNHRLDELEQLLAKNISHSWVTYGKDLPCLDEVDAADDFQNSGLNYDKVDKTLGNVVFKINQLRLEILNIIIHGYTGCTLVALLHI